tara:strand:+ start:110 stop:370 length:261 start_codon:yes stop_codon:yes gene_type:complete
MKNPIIYKNIKCNVNQLARLMTLTEKDIENQKEMISLYKDKLNGASNTEEVRFYQNTIKEKKDSIKILSSLKEQMSNNEFITKHTL